MKVPQSIENVFKNTRKAVNDASVGKQVPQDWSSLMGEFYFNAPTGNITNSEEGNNTGSKKIVLNPGNVEISYGSISIDTEIAGDLYIDGEKIGHLNANSKGNKVPEITTCSHKIEIKGLETFEQNTDVGHNQRSSIVVKSKKVKDLPGQIYDSRDQKHYKIVKIGKQSWMAENLAFNYGTGCWAYDNNLSNIAKYG
jgi:hypothetical protein